MNSVNIKVIGFDADDTLWANETLFLAVEARFRELMEPYCSADDVSSELFNIEMQYLPIYGFGVKGFMLAMIETALKVSGEKVANSVLSEILRLGQELLDAPVVLLDGAKEVLLELKDHYRLVLATKGDLLDQERKLERSGLVGCFHHIEVMSDKRECDYRKLLRHLDVSPREFLMVGNSLKSDILPVLRLGGEAVYVPYHVTWQHEVAEPEGDQHYHQIKSLVELPALLP